MPSPQLALAAWMQITFDSMCFGWGWGWHRNGLADGRLVSNGAAMHGSSVVDK